MYIGPLDSPTLANRLLCESFCFILDEVKAKRCTSVKVELGPEGFANIIDDGPGWRPDMIERFMTQIAACRKAKEHEEVGETVCMMGIAVLNALTERSEIHVWKDGAHWWQDYKHGEPQHPVANIGPTTQRGTMLTFLLDPTIVQAREFDTEKLVEWLGEHACGLLVEILDKRTDRRISLDLRQESL